MSIRVPDKLIINPRINSKCSLRGVILWPPMNGVQMYEYEVWIVSMLVTGIRPIYFCDGFCTEYGDVWVMRMLFLLELRCWGIFHYEHTDMRQAVPGEDY